ncbi:MAG: hypothetical protein WA989_02010 [Henriciella sp.]
MDQNTLECLLRELLIGALEDGLDVDAILAALAAEKRYFLEQVNSLGNE